MAFVEPKTGQILKIFGTQCDGSEEDPQPSKDQLMFKTYAEFCRRNQRNPYLPRIYGWETFVYPTRWGRGNREQQCLYLQIRTEPLEHFTNQWALLFGEMAFAVSNGIDFSTWHEDMQSGDVYPTNYRWYSRLSDNDSSVTRLRNLYATMEKLYQIGRAKGFVWDLHGNNIMKRTDGTPVITDPWVL